MTAVIVTSASGLAAPPCPRPPLANRFSIVVVVALTTDGVVLAITGSLSPDVTVIVTVAAGEVSVPSVAV